jgi:hypothetical protein
LGESSEEKDERIPRVFSFVPMKKRQNVWYIRDYLLSLRRAIYEARHLYLLKSRKNMKKLTLLFSFLLIALAGQAQSVNVHKTKGEVVSYPMTEVSYVDFSDGDDTVGPPEGVEAVDLGLPSGTKWANMNVGATKPEEYGGYYAWGEIEEKSSYTQDNYTVPTKRTGDNIWALNGDMAYTQYDVAYMKWGGSWHMPTKEQLDELIKNTTWKWTQLNGVYGSKLTSKQNGKSIFLPAAGYRQHGALKYSGTRVTYWIAYKGYFLCCIEIGGNAVLNMGGSVGLATQEYGIDFYFGFPVRPVSD